MKRIISLLLALSILLCFVPAVYAADLPFVDVPEKAWYTQYVQYVYNNKLMNGVSETSFAPSSNMTRGMVVTVLYRAAGSPSVNADHPFIDVENGKWYDIPVAWGYDKNIVSGMTDTTFEPDSNVTREMLVALFYRFAGGSSSNDSADLSSFVDSNKIHNYAKDAFAWAVARGIVNGKDETHLDPTGYATRAECATMLQRLFTWVDDSPPTEPTEPEEPEQSDPTTSTEPTDTTPTNPTETIIEEKVIFEQDDIKITVLGLRDGRYGGKEIQIEVENNTNKNIYINANDFVLNGITMYCDMYIKCASNAKAIDSINISQNDIEFYNISDIATVFVKEAKILEQDTYEKLYDFSFTIESNISDFYVQDIDSSGQILFNQDGIMVTYQGSRVDNFGKAKNLFFVKNDTDNDIIVDIDNVTANGYTVYAMLFAKAYSNSVCYEYIDFLQSDLDDAGITDIKDIGLDIKVIDMHSYTEISVENNIKFQTK